METIKYMALRDNNTFAAFINIKKACPTVLRTIMMARLHTQFSEAECGDGNRRSVEMEIDVVAPRRPLTNCISIARHAFVLDGHESGDSEVKYRLREGGVLSRVLYRGIL